MSAELNQRVDMAIDGSAAALHLSGAYRSNVGMRLSHGVQRLHFTASKQVGLERAQNMQIESHEAQGSVVLYELDAALIAVQEVHRNAQWAARSAWALANDAEPMEGELMSADSSVQALYLHLDSSQLSAGTDIRIELTDHEVNLLCAFARAPQGWLSVQAINGVFACRGRQVQRHILELRLWRLRRKIKTLGTRAGGPHFVRDKGYHMGLQVCLGNDARSGQQSPRSGQQALGVLASPLVLYEQAMRLQYDGRWVDIQPHEIGLLSAMVRAASHRLTFAEVFGIYGWPDDLQHRKAVAVRLVRLRKKISELGVALPAIKAIRKVGYQLCLSIQLVENNGD